MSAALAAQSDKIKLCLGAKHCALAVKRQGINPAGLLRARDFVFGILGDKSFCLANRLGFRVGFNCLPSSVREKQNMANPRCSRSANRDSQQCRRLSSNLELAVLAAELLFSGSSTSQHKINNFKIQKTLWFSKS